MKKLSRRQFLQTLGVGALGGVVTASYCQDCADWLSIERSDLCLDRWDANGYKVALVADLHVGNEHETTRAQKAIEMALAEKPDLLVIAGDFVNRSDPVRLEHVTRSLEPLSGAQCPSVAVLGNHDYVCQHPRLLMEAIEKTPAKLLMNRVFDTQGVSVAGIDDATEHKEKYDFFPQNSVSKNCLAILHEPDYVVHMPRHTSLLLSGHTHGGQVCLPFGYPLHTPRGGRNYIAGFYSDARVPLYVTRGVGTTGVDYRLFCRPEVTILTLRSA